MRNSVAALAVCGALAFPAALAAEVGEDGLHKQPWFAVTFRDVAEDLADAQEAGKRLAIIFEQRGCVYCAELHEKVLSDRAIADYIAANFMVVQYNLYGDEDVIDLDGTELTEKEAARRWGVLFTPTVIFLDETAEDGADVRAATVSTMPGAFGKGTTLDMFTWVREKGYAGEEGFQRYHARMIRERDNGSTD